MERQQWDCKATLVKEQIEAAVRLRGNPRLKWVRVDREREAAIRLRGNPSVEVWADLERQQWDWEITTNWSESEWWEKEREAAMRQTISWSESESELERERQHWDWEATHQLKWVRADCWLGHCLPCCNVTFYVWHWFMLFISTLHNN